MSNPENRQPESRWRDGVALLPSIGLAVASKFTCSLCVAAYAGVLSSVGVGFLGTAHGLTILSLILLAVGLASLAWSWRRHRHTGPLALNGVGAVFLLLGRLTWSLPPVLYAGAGLVLAASVWNLWLGWRNPPGLVPLCRLGRTNS